MLLLFKHYPLELVFYIFSKAFLRLLKVLKVQTSIIANQLSLENLVKRNPLNKKVKKIDMDGLTFYIRGNDYTDFLTITSPTYEKTVMLFLQRVSLKKPGAFFDVGAHIGTYALRVAKMLPNTKVLAIEPSPLSAWLLGKSIECNGLGNVKVIPRAAYSVDGMVINLYFSDFSTGNTIYERHPKRSEIKLTKSIKVQTITLDNLAETNKLTRPIFLKIDAEGAEWEILNGAKKLIHVVDEMLLEIHYPAEKLDKGLCFCDVCIYLRGQGLIIQTVSSDKKSHTIYGLRL